MSKSDVLEPERIVEKAKKPAKGWVNKYRSDLPYIGFDRQAHGPGEFFGSYEFPSKEIAETKGLETELAYSVVRELGFKWVKAVPAEEAKGA